MATKYRILKNWHWYFIQSRTIWFQWWDNLNAKWQICAYNWFMPFPFIDYEVKYYKTLKNAENTILKWKKQENDYNEKEKKTFIKYI